MKRTTIYLDDETYEELVLRARRKAALEVRHISLSEAIRDAVAMSTIREMIKT